MPRRIRVSGMERRKLIRSRLVSCADRANSPTAPLGFAATLARALRDAGQASIHACITSTVVVMTEKSDNPVDFVNVAEADWDNQSTLLLNVDDNITGVYSHDHNDEVVEQCDDKVVSDTVGGDVIEQNIKQEPVNMPVAVGFMADSGMFAMVRGHGISAFPNMILIMTEFSSGEESR